MSNTTEIKFSLHVRWWVRGVVMPVLIAWAWLGLPVNTKAVAAFIVDRGMVLKSA